MWVRDSRFRDCKSRDISDVVERVIFWQRSTLYITRVRIMHCAKAILGAIADLSPDPVFTGDKIRETFADL